MQIFIVPSILEFRLVFISECPLFINFKEENQLDHNFMCSLMLYSLDLFEIDLIIQVLLPENSRL